MCPAGCYAESGDLQRAQQCYQRAIEAKRAALGPAHAAVAASLVALSQLLARQGRPEAAAQALQTQLSFLDAQGQGCSRGAPSLIYYVCKIVKNNPIDSLLLRNIPHCMEATECGNWHAFA